MKPRVFVSSTYYDLKHIRSNLEKTIEQFGFESVLFENGNVHFGHNRSIDISCYNEVQNCNMMILVVGGRYGTEATGEKKDEHIEEYERSFMSITRKEYKTAIKTNMPIFVFIDKHVYSNYETYKENEHVFTPGDEKYNATMAKDFKFAYVESINIFKFIDELRVRAICQFEKYDEIENYLMNQWSGMFYEHLMNLKNDKNDKKVLDSIDELKKATELMNIVVDSMGKKLLEDDYREVQKAQIKIICDYFSKTFIRHIKFKRIDDKTPSAYDLAKVIYECYLNDIKLEEVYSLGKYPQNDDEFKQYLETLEFSCSFDIFEFGFSIEVKNYEYDLYEYYTKIKPIIDSNSANDLVIEALRNDIDSELIFL